MDENDACDLGIGLESTIEHNLQTKQGSTRVDELRYVERRSSGTTESVYSDVISESSVIDSVCQLVSAGSGRHGGDNPQR